MATYEPGIEAVYDALGRLGYDVTVFDFNFVTQDGRENAAAPHQARVLITCTENSMHKIYNAVDGAWHTQFCEDIRTGLFGPPPKGVPFGEDRTRQLADMDRKARFASAR